MVNENLDSLPDEPANLAGESVDKGARYNIKVSNAAGYLCHIHMEVIALPMLLKRMGLSACLYESVACQFGAPWGLPCLWACAQSTFKCPPEVLFRIFTNPGRLVPCSQARTLYPDTCSCLFHPAPHCCSVAHLGLVHSGLVVAWHACQPQDPKPYRAGHHAWLCGTHAHDLIVPAMQTTRACSGTSRSAAGGRCWSWTPRGARSWR